MEKGFESGFTVLLKFFEKFCSSRVLEENYLFCENSLSYIPVLLVSLGISLLNWMNVAGWRGAGGGGGVLQCKKLLHFFNRGSKNV